MCVMPFAYSPLARYRILSPRASLRVSPLCLGSMNFGNACKNYMGECDQKTTGGILDVYYENGGNFIDTSNNYQNEESETWIGEWMKKRGNRDQMVIATKFSTNFRGRAGVEPNEIMANFSGNGTKSLHKLQTDYIDLVNFSTSIPELMQSLGAMVKSGKVLYLGISDTPAWVVSKANQYARDHGMRQFNREIIPMARDEGMAIAPWGALGGGAFKTEAQRKAQDGRQAPPDKKSVKISKLLEATAERKNTIITSVALAYVMRKTPYVFPIVGGRKVEHLKGNIEALTLS
ncbi:norsolorinic acid reductase [Apodospora peruviana]|uniref:Norsolorinic acid reductase n=1 Tax=Apodospora peruviana TaxID=516989 RepID=A0AAE0I4T3_9PEZI|nr:norsolorinic acid reductase [Apodospora peruviana]